MTTPFHKPRIEETTMTTGNGTTITLGGPPRGRQAILDAIGNNNSMLYTLADGNKSGWEVGLGHVVAGTPNTFVIDQVLFSSNGGAKIALSTTTPHKIFCAPTAGFATGDINYLDTVQSRMVEKDSGLMAFDHGQVDGTYTAIVDYELSFIHKFEALGGNITFDIRHWPPTGSEGIIQLDLKNFGLTASYIFPSNITWTMFDDSETTSFDGYAIDRGGSLRLPSNGTATIILRSSDGGATIRGVWI